MADTTHDVEIKHNLDEYAQKIKESNDLWDVHFAKVKAVNDELDKLFDKKFKDAGVGGAPGGTPISTTERANLRRYQNDFNLYSKDFHSIATLAKATAGGVGGGLYSMATGGGLGGFARGLTDMSRAVQQMRLSGSFAETVMGGAALGAVSGTGEKRTAKGVAAAETEGGIEGAIAVGAETGVGLGLAKAFAKLPGLAKWAIGGLLAAGGLDIFAMDSAMKDVYGRSRRAAGYGANLGQLTAFDQTMSRYVDTDSMMAAMGQAKYDFTSPAYLAAKLSGIHPKDWSDPAAMAEGTILSVQQQLKTYAPEKMLALAHARGFQDLGLSDQDLIRLYTGDQKDVNDLVKKAQGAAPSLDQSKDLQKRYQDLSTDIDLAGSRLRVMGEDILTDQIPAFKHLADTINDITEKYRLSPDSKPPGAPVNMRVPTPYSELGPSFWNGDYGSTPGGHYAFPGAGYGPGRKPSGAKEKAPSSWLDILGLSAHAGELGADPKAAKVPDNIQDIRDILARDNVTAGGMSDAGSFVGGILGAGGGITVPPNYTGFGGVGSGGGKGAYGPVGPRGTGAPQGKPDTGGTAVTVPGEAGLYRPVYHLSDKDLSDKVVDTIAGEAKAFNAAGTDAVIDNMMNRLGTHTYGPSGNLEEVARAKGQYTGWRVPDAKEAEFIRTRIKAIASGGLPDITKGSNEYRASWYHGPWGWKHPEGVNVGGNVFANNPRGGIGPYGAYAEPRVSSKAQDAIDRATTKPSAQAAPFVQPAHPSSKAPAVPAQTSMNDMRLYQMDKGMHVKVSNPAGADVNIQSAMLGALKGQYG